MESEKAKKSVANMEVLKDIRGLLSTTKEISPEVEAREELAYSDIEVAQYKAEIERYEELVQRQQEALKRLGKENTELTAKLNLLHSGKGFALEGSSPKGQEIPSPSYKSAQLNQEIAQLEEKKSEIEGLIQLKLGELSRRIARAYQMSGEGNLAIEFRKMADYLETAEDFVHLLRVLLREA
jgi:predicted RNase H-like nuclease (RuvC/YqgF family)